MSDDPADTEPVEPEDDGLEYDPAPVPPWVLNDVDPWDRQEREPAQAFEAFVEYRQMGASRSIRAVAGARAARADRADGARVEGTSAAVVARWSRRWRWVERVDLWDARQHTILVEQYEQRTRTMAERHARLGGILLRVAAERLLGREAQDGRPAVEAIDPNELTALDVVRMIRYGVQVEAGAHFGLSPAEQRRVDDVAAGLLDRVVAAEAGDVSELEQMRAQVAAQFGWDADGED